MNEFFFQFPCYAIVKDYAIDPQTGSVILDDRIRFLSPPVSDKPERHLALFTDRALADDYSSQFDKLLDYRVFLISEEEILNEILSRVQDEFPMIVVDLNRKTTAGTSLELKKVLALIRQNIEAQRNRQRDG